MVRVYRLGPRPKEYNPTLASAWYTPLPEAGLDVLASGPSEKQYNAAESCSDRTFLFAAQEVAIEASVEDCRINISLLDLAPGGSALHRFRTSGLSNRFVLGVQSARALA